MVDLRRTPSRNLDFRFEIDHARKKIAVRATGPEGKPATGELDLGAIRQLMAILSHCEHALVLLGAGEKPKLPSDPDQIFESSTGEFKLGAYDEVRRFEAGIDDTMGMVGLTIWGKSARLSGFRLSPDNARSMARDLQAAADATPNPPPKRYQN
jgi:hypothetical protein